MRFLRPGGAPADSHPAPAPTPHVPATPRLVGRGGAFCRAIWSWVRLFCWHWLIAAWWVALGGIVIHAAFLAVRPPPPAPTPVASPAKAPAPPLAQTPGPPSLPAPEMAGEVVALVNERVITTRDLNAELARRGGPTREQLTPEQRQAIVQDLIRAEAFFQKARAAGFAEQPDLQAAIRQLVAQRYEREQLARLPAPVVTEAEIRAFYEQHRAARYSTSERIRAALLFIRVPPDADSATRAELLKRAQTAWEEAQNDPANPRDLGTVAALYSDHAPSRECGGDLGRLTRDEALAQLEKPVVEALFGLKRRGQISQGIIMPTGYYTVKLIERQPAVNRTLEQVREEIRRELALARAAEQKQQFYDQLIRDLVISVNPAWTNTPTSP